MGWKFCDCCTADNECLIHSSVESKGKPWPGYSLASGTAPTETSTGYEFGADATIVLDHDERFAWDPDTSAFIDPPQPHERKRLGFRVTLNDEESSVRVIFFEDGDAITSVKFRSWTPTLAKYPIVTAVYEWGWNESDGIGFETAPEEDSLIYEEHLMDRWQEGMPIDFNNATWMEDDDLSATYRGASYQWDGNYAGNHMVRFGELSGASGLVPYEYLGTTPSDNEQITIEVEGNVTIENLELWHDPTILFDANGEICPGEQPIHACDCALGWSGLPQLNYLPPQPIIGTIPHELLLTWPTMVDNPSYVGGSCGLPCSTGAGTEYSLVRGIGTPGSGWECTYGTESYLTYGCVSTGDEFLYFNPTHDEALIPWVDAAKEPSGTAVITDVDPDLHFTAILTETGYCARYNASVAYDHLEVSPYIWWETQFAYGEGNVLVKCIMPEGTNVDIRLPDSFTIDDV